MTGPAKITDNTLREMYALYERGSTLKEVGKKFGYSERAMSARFKKAGLATREKIGRGSQTRPRQEWENGYPIDEMYAAYLEGASLAQVGERFGVSRSQLCKVFKAAHLETRPQVQRRDYPLEDMYELYRRRATLQEVGEEFGLSRERVRQLFKAAGLQTRSSAIVKELERRSDEERAGEIIETFRKLKDPRLVASELRIPQAVVKTILSQCLSLIEYRLLRRESTEQTKPAKHTHTDTQLLAFLHEAACDDILTITAYREFARDRRMADGRPWPNHQTYMRRFGSWREALLKAGLPANSSTPVAGKVMFDREGCLEAVRSVRRAVGDSLTLELYEHEASRSGGSLPSGGTIRNRCGSWSKALRMAGI